MLREPKAHKAYRALLYLYPKAHRQEYGEQMVQAFDDLLSEDTRPQHTLAIWLRVVGELPMNIIEEHIHNVEGKKMSDLKPNKRLVIVVSAMVVVVVAAAIGLTVHQNKPFTGTTLARLQSPAKKPACLQKAKENAVPISSEQNEFVAQAAATSIVDVPAGTTVDTYIKTYTDTKATGTAVYGGKYGTYNFEATHKANSTDPYFGGWSITHFEACTV